MRTAREVLDHISVVEWSLRGRLPSEAPEIELLLALLDPGICRALAHASGGWIRLEPRRATGISRMGRVSSCPPDPLTSGRGWGG